MPHRAPAGIDARVLTLHSHLISVAVEPAIRAGNRRFYFRMACICALVAFVAVTPTYRARVATGAFAGGAILHLHGILFSAWMLYFIAQTALAASGRFERHRTIGLIGFSLATALLFVGIAAEIHSIDLGITAGREAQNRTFSIVPGNPRPIAFSLRPSFLTDLLLVVAVVCDWRERGRLHPACLTAGACRSAARPAGTR